MKEITCENINDVSLDELRQNIWRLIDVHVDYVSLDKEKFTYLLGYYPAIYSYIAELYAYMIHLVRANMELKERFKVQQCRDKRDILELAMKSLKLHYEGLSRKITILRPGDGDHETL